MNAIETSTASGKPGDSDFMMEQDSIGRNRHANGNGFNPSKAPPTPASPVKYRHVAAVHSKPRTSCLSHDSETTPSFLGFRNLMIIVLGMSHFVPLNHIPWKVLRKQWYILVTDRSCCVVVMNLRLVVENFNKVSCATGMEDVTDDIDSMVF